VYDVVGCDIHCKEQNLHKHDPAADVAKGLKLPIHTWLALCNASCPAECVKQQHQLLHVLCDGCPDVPGLLELLEASKKLAGLAVVYDDWRKDVKVYPVAPEAAAAMNYYTHLLDGVAQEQASIPVVLHGMLEQVTTALMHWHR
jgi:hypothetical protein